MAKMLCFEPEYFHLMLPEIIERVVWYVMERQGLSMEAAIVEIYTSRMYAELEEEATKLWHLGPVGLYEMLCDEKCWPRPVKRVEHWEPWSGGAEKR